MFWRGISDRNSLVQGKQKQELPESSDEHSLNTEGHLEKKALSSAYADMKKPPIGRHSKKFLYRLLTKSLEPWHLFNKGHATTAI
jgi:hypothetical protein